MPRENDTQLQTVRCQITGGVGRELDYPVECHELWAVEEGRSTLRLAGLTALAPEVHAAKHILTNTQDKQQQQTALWTLQAVNE